MTSLEVSTICMVTCGLPPINFYCSIFTASDAFDSGHISCVISNPASFKIQEIKLAFFRILPRAVNSDQVAFVSLVNSFASTVNSTGNLSHKKLYE